MAFLFNRVAIFTFANCGTDLQRNDATNDEKVTYFHKTCLLISNED